MAVCVIVLSTKTKANELCENLTQASTTLSKCILIEPTPNKSTSTEEIPTKTELDLPSLTPVKIKTLELLNPQISSQRRQRNMALWLMPFGLLAGLSFSQMTGLDTFAKFGAWGQPVISSLLGMCSGWIGSFFAAKSVNSANDDGVKYLRKKNEENRWLLLLETPMGVELPWQLIKASSPIETVRLNEL